jgi:hypothetical protein
MPNNGLQGTSGQRGFSKFTLQPNLQVTQNWLLQIPLAPEPGRSAIDILKITYIYYLCNPIENNDIYKTRCICEITT